MTPDWHAALAYALTGQRLPVTPAQTPDVILLLSDLSALGWTSERLAATARVARVVPAELMAGLGAAQFWALLAQLRNEIGATRAAPQVPTRRTALTAEYQRLRADLPPHW